MSSKIKRYTLAIIAVFAGLLSLRADEYSSSDYSDMDTIYLDAFTVGGGGDPWADFDANMSFDTANYQYELSQNGYEEVQTQIEASNAEMFAAAVKAFNDYVTKLVDSLDGVMNLLNGVGLVSPEKIEAYLRSSHGRNGGYVVSDGRGGFYVIVNANTIAEYNPQLNEKTLAIAVESARRHETTHALDAIAVNPNIFTNAYEGWAIGHAKNVADASEISAYNVQLGYLYDQINNNSDLTSSERWALEDFAAGVEKSKSNYEH